MLSEHQVVVFLIILILHKVIILILELLITS